MAGEKWMPGFGTSILVPDLYKFLFAKNYRPNLFEPCFSAKRPKIKQFGR
jgi:hypothetical protein